LPIQDHRDEPTAFSPLLGVREAAALVEGLRVFTLQDVGSSAWLRQHQALERLNAQAHQSARCPDACQGEFVLEAFVSQEKVMVLVQDLILLDCWKEKVWPRVMRGVVSRGATMRAYFVLFHEATVVNLLEVLFYHLKACEAVGDGLVDLVDYCAGKMALLNAEVFSSSSSSSSSRSTKAAVGGGEGAGGGSGNDSDVRARAAALAERDPEESLKEQARMIDFQVAITAVGILRLLCGYIDDLPLSVGTRLVHTHDTPLALIPLLENPPWTRKRHNSTNGNSSWEKLGPDFHWHHVAPPDLLLLTKHEAQAWLMLFHLLTSPQIRQRYHLNRYRKAQLLRLRKYMTEPLLDQIPVLADVRRYLDELALMDVPEPTAAAGGGRGGGGRGGGGGGGAPGLLLVEQVAQLRAGVLAGMRGKGGREGGEEERWEGLARVVLEENFGREGGDAQDEDLRRLASVYSSEWVEEVVASTAAGGGKATAAGGGGGEGRGAGGLCSNCEKEASKRCGRCNASEWYCGRECQVAKWKSHKAACDAVVLARAEQQRAE